MGWVDPWFSSPVNKMFSFELTRHCETSIDGMKKCTTPWASQKKTSPRILKDTLGLDGDNSVKDVQKAHESSMQKKRPKVNTIFRAIKYFEQK